MNRTVALILHLCYSYICRHDSNLKAKLYVPDFNNVLYHYKKKESMYITGVCSDKGLLFISGLTYDEFHNLELTRHNGLESRNLVREILGLSLSCGTIYCGIEQVTFSQLLR